MDNRALRIGDKTDLVNAKTQEALLTPDCNSCRTMLTMAAYTVKFLSCAFVRQSKKEVT